MKLVFQIMAGVFLAEVLKTVITFVLFFAVKPF